MLRRIFDGIRGRLIFTYLFLTFISMIILGFLVLTQLREFYMTNLEDNLTEQAHLVKKDLSSYLLENNYFQIQKSVDELGDIVKARITIIKEDGQVVADSESDPDTMDNHANRPEIKDAFEGKKGSSLRFSKTLNEEMFYLAIPAMYPEHQNYVVRLSISLARINSTLGKLKNIFFGNLFFALLFITLLSLRISKKITRPIEEISVIAGEISHGNLDKRIFIREPRELGRLAESINSMTLRLKEKIEELDESNSRLQTIMDNLSSGIILLNKDGFIEVINPAASNFLDISSEEIKGKHHLEIIRNFELSGKIQEASRQGLVTRMEMIVNYPERTILETLVIPVKKEPQILGVIIVMHDITELRQLEQMKTELVANASHELRTPVTAIKGYTETLLDGAMENKELLHRFLKVIDAEAERLIQLLGDLLNLSRLESNKNTFSTELVPYKKLIQEAVESIYPKISSKKLHLDLDLVDINVEADRDGLKRVILNLLENSIKYTPAGGKIGVITRVKEGKVITKVWDTGSGIPEEDLPRIFERFYRVDKARTRKKGGAGLGLSIVKHLVKAHGGEIWAESKTGKGTTIGFIIPLKRTE